MNNIDKQYQDLLQDIQSVKNDLLKKFPNNSTVHVRDGIFCSSLFDVILENYESHPTIKAPLSN